MRPHVGPILSDRGALHAVGSEACSQKFDGAVSGIAQTGYSECRRCSYSATNRKELQARSIFAPYGSLLL